MNKKMISIEKNQTWKLVDLKKKKKEGSGLKMGVQDQIHWG
jgi:hypothetical protein